MKHLTIGGSTAARTLGCPAWINKSKDIPKRPGGSAAIEGSMHHEIMELCQNTGTRPWDHLGFEYKEAGTTLVFDEDHLDLSNIAYNATNELFKELDIDELEVEPFVEIIPDVAGGSIDTIGLSGDRKTLLILDYKFGRVKVSPEENAQMMFYALAAKTDAKTSDLFEKVEKLVLVIVQPRHSGVVFRWVTDMGRLNTFEKHLKTSIANVKTAKKGTPGAHCGWCPASAFCPEKRQEAVVASTLGTSSHNELMASAAAVQEVEAWVKATKEALYMQLTTGINIPGWKVVEKKATRKWAKPALAEKALVEVLGESAFKKELLTVAQMEKKLKSKGKLYPVETLVERKSSGTTLAPESDSRPEAGATEIPSNLAQLLK
jgi:hypothetical protein|tara:strand:+ start:519 stop:1646 length:1128 start_codon:yes stop_codon:yes gene_type:complete